MKVVIDTNIHISAFGFGGSVAKLVDYCYSTDNCTVYLSQEIFDEIKTKFLGGRLAKIKKENFIQQKAVEYIDNIFQSTIFARPSKNFDICRDPKDNMIIDLAFDVKADFIITGDEDLLILNEFEGTKILKPSQFLTRLDQK
jgi:uncharacterized protein